MNTEEAFFWPENPATNPCGVLSFLNNGNHAVMKAEARTQTTTYVTYSMNKAQCLKYCPGDSPLDPGPWSRKLAIHFGQRAGEHNSGCGLVAFSTGGG